MLSEMTRAQTPDYKMMLMQGVCMCLWYNTGATLVALEQTGHTQNVFSFLEHLLQTTGVKQDFEIKRIVLGLSQLVHYAGSQAGGAGVPPQVAQNMPMVMKALVHLAQKSIVVREKNHEKAEQAEEDNCEGAGIIEDEEADGIDLISDDEDDEDDEDYDCNEDFEGHDLYDSKLDAMDEVLFLRDLLISMQGSYPEAYSVYFGQMLDGNDLGQLEQAI